MKTSVIHLKRYREIAALLWKYGRSDLVHQMRKNEDFAIEELKPVAEGSASPEQLADDLEAMGPTYVKLGQVLAGRPDLLPESYLKALARLQDKVKPFPYEDVERIVMDELGVRISKAFSRFDREPTAAASLGQVHRAALRDGTPVVVKVQRPDIRRQIAEDFEVLAQIAGFLDEFTGFGRRFRLPVLLEEFRATIQQELNYEREAQNLVAVGENLKEFELIQVPQPVPDYCTRSVLTMDCIAGRKVTSLGPLAQLDLDGALLAETLFRAYLKQVLIDGLFHADPHPGNVFITDAGHLALLDLGMVGHVASDMQERLLKLLIAVSDGAGEEVAEIVFRMSEKMEPFDLAEFRHRIAQLVAIRRDQGLQQLNIGRTLLDLSTNARENGVFVPPELVLLGKTLLQLDEVGRILDPAFDPSASIRRHIGEIMAQRLRKDVTKGSLLASLLETKDFISNLPGRLNHLMDAAANSELEVKVKAVDAKMMLEGMQKIANRITAGIVLAALIMGASLLALVPSHLHVFGYPAMAILCFLAAATGGGLLVVAILFQDHKIRKKYPH
jgi:predicted unusual protein kinase regulating ubiquinone biosynthesis (AarF/ABC1/UbiB family)